MKIKLSIALIVFLGISRLCSSQVYRWDYKICIDTAGARVYETVHVKRSSIHKLVNIERPSDEEKKGKRAEAEKQKVKLTGYIVMLGQEHDGDYHLVVTNSSKTDSLIAEIPDPNTKKLKGYSFLKADYQSARSFIESKIDAHPGSISELPHPVKVRITGIVFFDKIAHGKGHSPNGVEIHPVLKIEPVN